MSLASDTKPAETTMWQIVNEEPGERYCWADEWMDCRCVGRLAIREPDRGRQEAQEEGKKLKQKD